MVVGLVTADIARVGGPLQVNHPVECGLVSPGQAGKGSGGQGDGGHLKAYFHQCRRFPHGRFP